MKLYRADGLLDPQALRYRTLVVAGLGSLGSQVMSALAYPFGRIILADPDTLKRENIERHLCGKSQVGRPKVEAVKAYLVDRDINPKTITVSTEPAEALLPRCPDGTIVVASVDGYAARAAINAICYRRNFPTVFGGVFPRGTGGDVTILPAPAQVCYLCSSWLTQTGSRNQATHDYGLNPTQSSNEEAPIPALKAPVMAIASEMAMAVLDIVAGQSGPPQVMRFLHQWEGIWQFHHSEERRAIVGRYISALRSMHLEPNLRLEPANQGFTLEARRGIVSFVLSSWSQGCPLHAATVSLSDI